MYKRSCYLSLLLSICSLNCLAQNATIPYSDKHIAYEGRIANSNNAAVLMWPGTSVTLNFIGTELTAQLKDSDTSNYYNVIIDKDNVYTLHTDTTLKAYELVSGLPKGRHTIQLFKRTEWDKGRTLFYGFGSNEPISLLKPAKPLKRKIEFFGNSITCGYAVEDYVHDSPIGYYENNYDSYAAITARHFKAQYHCTAKSGIGIMVSWFPLIMPEMYDRLDPENPSSKWNFSSYTPDLVVINLFQNDSWIVNLPENEQFKARFGSTPPDKETIIKAYKNFVHTVRSKYPKASIICMLGNMDITRKGSPWPDYVQQAVDLLNDKKIYTYFAPYKNTPGHPKTAEQKMLADGLIKFIEENIHW